MARYKVEFKAFKTGEWYTKTETDHIASAYSVAAVQSQGRASRVTDTEEGIILQEDDGDASMYSYVWQKLMVSQVDSDTLEKVEGGYMQKGFGQYVFF